LILLVFWKTDKSALNWIVVMHYESQINALKPQYLGSSGSPAIVARY